VRFGASAGTTAVASDAAADVGAGAASTASARWIAPADRNSDGIKSSDGAGATLAAGNLFLRGRWTFARSARFLAFFGALSGRGITDALASSDMVRHCCRL
jgi:hypothetical protein